MWVFQNDGFVKEENALLSFKDLSFQRGYGIFDFFRLSGNEPLFLDDHLDRFYFSAAEMRLPVSLQREELEDAICQLIRRNNLPNSGVRLSLTGGQSKDDFSIGTPNFLLSQHLFTPPSEEQVRKGTTLFTHSYQRQLPQVKTIDYLMAVWLQPKRMEKGADDTLYHQNGIISECPRSNVFFVTENDSLVTPAGNVLAGITRKKIIQLARQHFQVEEREVSLEEIETAGEAFLTSTTKQVLPVAAIDNKVFAKRNVTEKLRRLFRKTFYND
jgi:branched-chain amino acid aminotransferase